MQGNVEIADPEGKVHRVDVFERRGNEREVRQADDEGERGQRAGRGHETGRSRSASLRLPRR